MRSVNTVLESGRLRRKDGSTSPDLVKALSELPVAFVDVNFLRYAYYSDNGTQFQRYPGAASLHPDDYVLPASAVAKAPNEWKSIITSVLS